jgi:DNA polymerase III subunit epsilon
MTNNPYALSEGKKMMLRKWAIQTTLRVVATTRCFSTNVDDGSCSNSSNEVLIPVQQRPAIALIFDTETTGHANFREPASHFSQPDLVQLGFILVDTSTWKKQLQLSMLIQPTAGLTKDIDPGAQAVHGITKQDCELYGVPLPTALQVLMDALAKADCVVAHNLRFDRAVIETALFRSGMILPPQESSKNAWTELSSMPHRSVCTMQACIDVLRLPSGRSSYKWPSLSECYTHFTKQPELQDAHDALADANACMTIFRNLLEQQLIPPIPLRVPIETSTTSSVVQEATAATAVPVPVVDSVESPPATTSRPSMMMISSTTVDAATLDAFRQSVVSGELLVQAIPDRRVIVVTGNTYQYKDVLKLWGGRWDGIGRVWTFADGHNAAKLQDLRDLIIPAPGIIVPAPLLSEETPRSE